MNKDEMKKVYDDRTCLRCGDYVAIDGNHIDVPTCELTLSQVLAKVNSYQATYPERGAFRVRDC